MIYFLVFWSDDKCVFLCYNYHVIVCDVAHIAWEVIRSGWCDVAGETCGVIGDRR
jgi:hypothetical protein